MRRRGKAPGRLAWTVAMLAGMLALLGACQSSRAPTDYRPTVARFFLEAEAADGLPLVLPRSGVHLAIGSKPVISESDISNVELVQVDLGRCLLFQLTPAAARDFYRLSVTQNGRRLVLVVDGEPLGARRIDGAIANGVLFVFLEVADEVLPVLAENLKKTSQALQREAARR